MDNSLIKKLLYTLIVIMALNLIYGAVFIPRNLKSSLENIKELKEDVKSTREELQFAKKQSMELLGELENQRKFLNDIQAGVEILELERRKNNEIFTFKKDSLEEVINDFITRKDSTFKEVPIFD